MKYVSTRNQSVRLRASQAIAQGLARDGGLLTPEVFPKLTPALLEDLRGKTYGQRAVAVMKLFLEDFSEEELTAFTQAGYSGEKFDDARVAPLEPLTEDTYCLELWHGPTSAFKDMALQILPHLLSASLVKNQEDKPCASWWPPPGTPARPPWRGSRMWTGPKSWCFIPKDGVSAVQALQMQTQQGNNVGVCAVHGNFDDAQTGVKTLFSDEKLREDLARRGYFLSSANSINWGRILPQLVYYISAYCDLLRDEKDPARPGGERLRPHRKLRQHSGRLLRQGDGRAHRQAHLRLQQQQCTDRLPVHRRVRPQPHLLQYDVPLHGYPDLLQPGAAALLPV